MLMNYFYSFLINNFILLCIIVVMVIDSIQKFNEHKKLSIFVFLILGTSILLAIFETLKDYAQNSLENIPFTTLLSSINYILRPSCILLFIFLIGQSLKKKWDYLLFVPIIIAIIIYILPLIPSTRHLVFYFDYNPQNVIVFFSVKPLRYTCHVVSLFYLGYLVFLSVKSLKRRHLSHAVIIFISILIIIAAAAIETFDYSGEIRVLTNSIGICTVFYYLYVYSERNKYDPLTGLFNRSMYYVDLPKLESKITGVIQIDMNGLKYINDNFGHIEGDLSLEIVSATILRASTPKMYVYRLGGDEFLVLAVNEPESKIINTMSKIREELAKTDYSCALGYAYRDDKSITVETLLKDAEKKMYLDKDAYYKTSKIKRRETL